MKDKVAGICRALLFTVILVICIFGVSSLLERKTSDIKYADFFEQKADYDVLFIGTSHVVNAIFPMELWEDYGIVSYNFGGHGNQMGTNYWVMMNALDHTTPKLVVLDVFGMHYDGKRSATAEQMHEAFDAFPMSITKYKMVQDLFDESDEAYSSRWEYFWDFGKYHSRWNDLKAEDFNPVFNKEKGAEMRIAVDVPGEYPVLSPDDVQENHTVAVDYLCKMIEECQARGIQVLLTHVPYPAEPGYQRAGNIAYSIAEKYGVEYIDFIQMNNVVDFMVDCYDVSSHLNVSGGRKVTDYLGNYIMSHYAIPDRRGDAAYARWHEDYQEYVQLKYEKLDSVKNLDDCLMLLRDENLSSCIYISAESGYLQDPVIHRLLSNVRGDTPLPVVGEATLSGSDYLMIVDNAKAAITEADINAAEEVVETSMGRITYVHGEQENPSLYLDGMEQDFLMSEQEYGMVLAKVIIFDQATGEIVSVFTEETE